MSEWLTRRRWLTLGSAAALVPGTAHAAGGEDDGDITSRSRLTTERWNFLRNSFWYVPAANLRAYLYTPTTELLTYVPDQTVFHITDYRRGYFWGVVGTKLGTAAISYQSIVGSVTPFGAVYLTFTPFNPNLTSNVTVGFGEMRQRLGQWTMLNQMSSGPGVPLSILHWAYMVQTRPGRRSWASLPGVGMSVPDFLADCPAGPRLRRQD